jgi:hypothetical protein
VLKPVKKLARPMCQADRVREARIQFAIVGRAVSDLLAGKTVAVSVQA